MKIKCEKCGAEYNVPNTYAGKKAKCLKCQESIYIHSQQENKEPLENKQNKSALKDIKINNRIISISNKILNSTILFAKGISILVIVSCILSFILVILALIFVKPDIRFASNFQLPTFDEYLKEIELRKKVQNIATKPNSLSKDLTTEPQEVLLLEERIRQLSAAYRINEELFYQWISRLEINDAIEKTETFLTGLEYYLASIKNYYTTKNYTKNIDYEDAAKYYAEQFIRKSREYGIDLELIELHNISQIEGTRSKRIMLGLFLPVILCFMFLFTIMPLLIKIENNTRDRAEMASLHTERIE